MKTQIRMLLLGVALGLADQTAAGQGFVVARHWGAADPLTEGFTRSASSGSAIVGPLTDDLGRDAWHIGQPTLMDLAAYRLLLSPEQQGMLGNGWVLSATLRLLSPFGQPSSGAFVGFCTGSKGYHLEFCTTPTGDPKVVLLSERGFPQNVFSGVGTGYHTYEMRYDPALGQVGLWFDGSQLVTEMAGAANPSVPYLVWGGGQFGGGSTYANWHEVTLRVIPEPSSLALLVVGGGGLLVGRRCRRRGIG